MRKNMKKIIMIIVVLLGTLLLSSQVKAASARISASSTSVYVGDSVTITATYTAASWNLTISGNGVATTKYADVTSDAENATRSSSVKLNTSTPGTYTIYLTGDVTDGTTGDTVMVNSSVVVTVKEKPVETPQQTPTQTPTVTQPTTQQTTTQKPTQNTQTEVKEEKKEEKKEEELPLGISTLTLYGVNGNGEKAPIEITPAFNINTYEYACNVGANINKIEIEKNANGYDEYLQIIGLEEGLKEGENTIILKLSKDGANIEYKIIVHKETVDVIEEIETFEIIQEVEKESALKTFFATHWICIVVTIVLMIIEAVIIIVIFKKKYA